MYWYGLFDMKKSIHRSIRKLYLSVHIGIGGYEKKLIGHTLTKETKYGTPPKSNNCGLPPSP